MKNHLNEPQLKCIFFVKFHSKLGPQMKTQCPQSFLSAESFKEIDPKELCPKEHLCQKVTKFGYCDVKIVGYPIWLRNDSKYAEHRDVLRFNVCFVFSYESNTTRYNNMIAKLADCVCRLEEEQNFVTNLEEGNEELLSLDQLISNVFNGLKTTGFCYIKLPDSTMLGLKPEQKLTTHFNIQICDVPILLYPLEHLDFDRWDLISVKVLKSIDGLRNVKEIVSLVNSESSLVLACFSNLKALKYVALSSTFRDSNLYLVTPKLNKLSKDAEFRQLCLMSVKAEQEHSDGHKDDERGSPNMDDILRAYSLISNNLPLNKIGMEVQKVGIDVRKLVQFGVTNGILKKLYRYPFLINNSLFDDLSLSVDSSSTTKLAASDTTVLAGNLPSDGNKESSGVTSARKGSHTRAYSRTAADVAFAPKVTITRTPDSFLDDRIQFIRSYLDGSHHTEELACIFNTDVDCLESMLESCDTILMYMK